jgi:hypothetical protein
MLSQGITSLDWETPMAYIIALKLASCLSYGAYLTVAISIKEAMMIALWILRSK